MDIGGLPVRYHDGGATTVDVGTGPGDADTVVLLHGGGPGASSWSNFGQTMPVIAGRYRTVMMDLPGYGQTAARPATGHFFTVAAEALAGLLDHLGIGKAHLIGNSLGGGAALRFALDFPKRAGRLVLMGPGGLTLNVLRARPDRGRPAADGVRRAAGPEPGRRWPRSCGHGARPAR